MPRTNLAQGLPYWVSLGPDSTYPDVNGELTDGVKGSSSFGDPAWQGHLRNEFRVVTLDLGAPKPADEVRVGFLYAPDVNIHLPAEVILYTSADGQDWSEPKRVTRAMLGTPYTTTRQEITFRQLDGPVRYVRLVFSVYIWTFIDEVEVWGEDRVALVDGPTDLLDMSDPLLGFDPEELGPGLTVHQAPPPNVNAYAAPGTEAAGGAQHIALIYTHQTWGIGEALPYVAYGRRDESGNRFAPPKWEDWFFDSFLFLALRSPDGHAFDAPSRGTPATWKQWMWFLDHLFTPGQQLDAFDQAIARAKQTIDDPDYKARIFVMIPYPMSETQKFGDPTGSGRTLDFSPFPARWRESLDDRTAAIEAYLEEFFRRWEANEYENLELAGLYWLSEVVTGPTDYALIQRVAPLVKERNMPFLWIPYYGAGGWANWEAFGFDAAIYQPNYMFNANVPIDRFRQVTEGARRYGMGIEIEADSSVLRSAQGRRRYLDYLDAGVQYGFMTEALHGYYQDVSVLGLAFASTNEDVRAIYDATYQYVKGTYEPAGE